MLIIKIKYVTVCLRFFFISMVDVNFNTYLNFFSINDNIIKVEYQANYRDYATLTCHKFLI